MISEPQVTRRKRGKLNARQEWELHVRAHADSWTATSLIPGGGWDTTDGIATLDDAKLFALEKARTAPRPVLVYAVYRERFVLVGTAHKHGWQDVKL